MFNFTERLRKINFARYDNDGIKLGVDEGEAAILKEGLLKPKDDPEYKQSLSKVISSYTTLTETAADSDFMQKFKSHHKDDGEYDKFNKMVDVAVMTKEKARKNKEKDLNRAKRNMEVTASVAEAVTSGMEDPAKSFFNSLFKIMQDEKMNALKLKEIKDDDLDFDLSAEIDKATGNEGTLDKAAESQGVKLDPPENKSTGAASDPKAQEKIQKLKDESAIQDAKNELNKKKSEGAKDGLTARIGRAVKATADGAVDVAGKAADKAGKVAGDLLKDTGTAISNTKDAIESAGKAVGSAAEGIGKGVDKVIQSGADAKVKLDTNKAKLEAIKNDLMNEWDSNKWSSGSMESKIELVKDKKFDDFLRDEHKRAWRSVHKEIGDLDKLEDNSGKDSDKKNFSERIELAIGVSNELSGTDW